MLVLKVYIYNADEFDNVLKDAEGFSAPDIVKDLKDHASQMRGLTILSQPEFLSKDQQTASDETDVGLYIAHEIAQLINAVFEHQPYQWLPPELERQLRGVMLAELSKNIPGKDNGRVM